MWSGHDLVAVTSVQNEADALQCEVAPPTVGVEKGLRLRFFKVSALGLSHKVSFSIRAGRCRRRLSANFATLDAAVMKQQ